MNALLIFFLDLSHIIEKEPKEGVSKQSRDELYFHQFLDILVNNYKFQHYVEFYADKLHITRHYLTLIVKRLSGQTVSDLIFQLLFAEATQYAYSRNYRRISFFRSVSLWKILQTAKRAFTERIQTEDEIVTSALTGKLCELPRHTKEFNANDCVILGNLHPDLGFCSAGALKTGCEHRIGQIIWL